MAREGTGFCSSTTLHCTACLHPVQRHGRVTSAQQLVGAALSHPDRRDVMPGGLNPSSTTMEPPKMLAHGMPPTEWWPWCARITRPSRASSLKTA